MYVGRQGGLRRTLRGRAKRFAARRRGSRSLSEHGSQPLRVLPVSVKKSSGED